MVRKTGANEGLDGIRCNACGARLVDASTPCGTCGVGPESGRPFWRTFWIAMLISTILVIIVSALVLAYAPRYAPHLFRPDPRNVLP